MNPESNITRLKNRKQQNVTHNDNFTFPASPAGVSRLTEKFEYDLDAVDAFLDVVFHSEFKDDEELLVWSTNGVPGYPISDSALFKKLERAPIPKALYFGTGTARRDADGNLYNRKSLFNRMHVLVLDDIGTKIPTENIPPALTPTYIIESSLGNFQYGYVWETPIDDLSLAEALIQVVYESGVTDKGGKTPMKLVRLPDGINGKKNENQHFHVRLETSAGPRWTPERFLDVLNAGVTWDDIVADPIRVAKARAATGAGVTAWAPQGPGGASLDGVRDIVLDWLYSEAMVKQETNDWVTIRCPWADTHTSPGDTAGYSPIGRGSGKLAQHRQFHCFHDHCSTRTVNDLLQYAAANGGPQDVPRFDPVANLAATYVFDAVQHGVWQIKDAAHPRFVKWAAFTVLHPNSVGYINSKGQEKRIKESQLFAQSPNRVTVWGSTLDPTTEAPMVEMPDGALRVNTFEKPKWGAGPYDPDIVGPFLEFLAYLMPMAEGRAMFKKWLVCKAHNLAFRGPAFLMIALAQGTGRTTLGNMLSVLFGAHNCVRVPFDTLITPQNFNEWQEKILVIADETLAVQDPNAYYRAYEKLKENIDTSATQVTINRKYGGKADHMATSSFLLFSNHLDAVSFAHNDRRLYPIRNAFRPNPPEYFTELHRYLAQQDEDGQPLWARHVWRYLLAQEPDYEAMNAPVEDNFVKSQMQELNEVGISGLVVNVLRAWPSPILQISDLLDVMRPHYFRVAQLDGAKGDRIARRTLTAHLEKLFLGKAPLRLPETVSKDVIRPYVIANRIQELGLEKGGRINNFLIDHQLTREVVAVIAGEWSKQRNLAGVEQVIEDFVGGQ